MSIFLNFICLECENADCDRTGIACQICNPRYNKDNGECLDFVEKEDKEKN